MSAKERTLWEQAVKVLQQNSITTTTVVYAPRAEPVAAKAGSKLDAASSRH
jgi:hypothetical protein